MRTPIDAAAAQLVELFGDQNWLPHAAALTFVDGEWYRVEAKRLEPIATPEMFDDDD